MEFYSENIFEKLVHLVGFIIRIYHDARSPEPKFVSVSIKCSHCLNAVVVPFKMEQSAEEVYPLWSSWHSYSFNVRCSCT